MSGKYDRHDRHWTFDCDGDGCHRNFEGSPTLDARSAWIECRDAGWVNSLEYEGNISTWRHFCPECKKQLGD